MVKTAHGFHYYFDKTNLLGGNKRYSSVGIDILNGNSYAVLPFSAIKCDVESCSLGLIHEYQFVKTGNNFLPQSTQFLERLMETRKSKAKSKLAREKAKYNSKLTESGLKPIEKDGKVFSQNIHGMHLAWIRKHKRKPLKKQSVFIKPSEEEFAAVIKKSERKKKKERELQELLWKCRSDKKSSSRKRARAYAKKMGIEWKLVKKGGE